MNDVDEQILWLAGVICMPTRRAAIRAVFDQIKKIRGFTTGGMHWRPGASNIFRAFAERVRSMNPVLATAFDLIALRPKDAATTTNIVAGANGLLCSANGDTSEARARLRVWDDVVRGKYDPTAYAADFFVIAEKYWPAEMQHIVATIPGAPMRDRYSHPALQTLIQPRWDWAFGSLQPPTRDVVGDEQMARLIDAVMRDRTSAQAAVEAIVEDLYAGGTPSAGALALAWSMLTADPRKLASFSMLPQLQFAIDHADLEAEGDADVRERIRIWWRAAEGEWTGSEVSIFRIADVETQQDVNVGYLPDPQPELQEMTERAAPSATLFADLGPTLVVMPSDKSTKLNNFHSPYKDLVDAALPLVVVRDVAGMRAALHAEFPHATVAVDLLLRDLRVDKPFFIKPACLVGSPGSGKSRLVRRVVELVRGLHVLRFDAASSTDAVSFSGSAKSWSNTEPSVPFRAIAQSKTANPVLLIDEIEKSSGQRHAAGRLHDALLPFLDRETASRYRDQSLDAEIDSSFASFIATANDVSKLPSPLRDRFRIIRVPSPTLQHLPALAANVMRDLAIEDEARAYDAPLATDELAVIGKAWERSRFSMRSLQKIVSATLDARDSYAMRH
jgi:ATP-dependent Lon protease